MCICQVLQRITVVPALAVHELIGVAPYRIPPSGATVVVVPDAFLAVVRIKRRVFVPPPPLSSQSTEFSPSVQYLLSRSYMFVLEGSYSLSHLQSHDRLSKVPVSLFLRCLRHPTSAAPNCLPVILRSSPSNISTNAYPPAGGDMRSVAREELALVFLITLATRHERVRVAHIGCAAFADTVSNFDSVSQSKVVRV